MVSVVPARLDLLALFILGFGLLPTQASTAQPALERAHRSSIALPEQPLQPLDPEDDCERDPDDCNPVGMILGVVLAEYLPALIDGVRFGPAYVPGGMAVSARMEWGLVRQSAARADLGVGVWTRPWGRPVGSPGPDDSFFATLGGSTLLYDVPNRSASVRAVAEPAAFWGDTGWHLRLTTGPRLNIVAGKKNVTLDLVVGVDAIGRAEVTPHAGLRLGVRWD